MRKLVKSTRHTALFLHALVNVLFMEQSSLMATRGTQEFLDSTALKSCSLGIGTLKICPLEVCAPTICPLPARH